MERCRQCRLNFKETSIQRNRREKKDLPIICQECYRICMAESREKKRQKNLLKQKPSSEQETLTNLQKEHGKLSESLIMRHLRVSSEEAKTLHIKHNLKKI